MDNRAIALKLILDHLDTADISDVDRRMEAQKAVYLAQASGIPLGYSYGWYLKGPYSPSLTRDYYSIGDETVPAGASLKATAIQKLDRVRALMDEPLDELARPQKLELLASLHYLIKSSGFSEEVSRGRVTAAKPHLAEFVTRGVALLKASNLL